MQTTSGPCGSRWISVDVGLALAPRRIASASLPGQSGEICTSAPGISFPQYRQVIAAIRIGSAQNGHILWVLPSSFACVWAVSVGLRNNARSIPNGPKKKPSQNQPGDRPRDPAIQALTVPQIPPTTAYKKIISPIVVVSTSISYPFLLASSRTSSEAAFQSSASTAL
jgi:hypothetical protein